MSEDVKAYQIIIYKYNERSRTYALYKVDASYMLNLDAAETKQKEILQDNPGNYRTVINQIDYYLLSKKGLK